jgi:DNA-binding transcriptional LysR family regulator
MRHCPVPRQPAGVAWAGAIPLQGVPVVNLRSLDLNLLVIFDALIEERSITAAARKVGVSQSAMSHALRRLRETFKDDLFRRTPSGLVPTTRALHLASTLRLALNEIGTGLNEHFQFDPKTSSRTFHVQMSDYAVGCLLPRMCARVRAEAPGVKLIVHHPNQTNPFELDTVTDLQLLVCAPSRPPSGYKVEHLKRSPFMVVMRRDHPIAKAKMTPKLFLGLPLVRVDTGVSGRWILDDELARRGLSRNIVLNIPSLTGIIPILKHTDLCAILPKVWALLYSQPGDLAMSPLPMPGFDYTVDLVTGSRYERDPGHRWLRQIVREELRALYDPDGGRLD